MPFPSQSRPATAPAFAGQNAPALSTAPAMTSPPPMPGAAPTPPPQLAPPVFAGPNLWIGVNGAAQLLTFNQYSAMPLSTPAMAENQIGGWKPIAEHVPVMAAAASPNASIGRAAFAGPAAPTQLPVQAAAGVNAGVFAGIEGAQIIRRGEYTKDGNYVLRLGSAEMKQLRSGKMALLLETMVVVSSYDPNDPKTADCHKEGEAVTIFINKNDSFNGNVKELIIALSGIDKNGQPRPDTDMVRQEEAAALVGPQQPFANVLFYIEARTRPMRNDPSKNFTNINYWPMPLMPDGVTPDLDRFAREIR